MPLLSTQGELKVDVDDAQGVVFAQEGLLVDRADFDVVDALHIGVVGVDSGVGEGAVLADGLVLQIGRAEVGKGIAAGVVVIGVLADIGSEVEDGVCADDACVGRGRC